MYRPYRKDVLLTIYFTADLHFGHSNIIQHCGRPFCSVEEMDQALLENWNRRVRTNDTIYILGDFMFFCKDPESYLRQLSGKKHLIVGNHDRVWMKKVRVEDHFESVQSMLEISDGTHYLTLCHYPMMTWNRVSHGSYMIYGHIHNNTGGQYWPLLHQMDQALNAGVDVNRFMPVTFEEMVENNRLFRAAHPPRAEQTNSEFCLSTQ